MKSQEFKVHRFKNGLTLIGEQMEAVSSAALAIYVPLGACIDPLGLEGSATVLGEMFQKGAGQWGSHELSEQFENNGVQRGNSTSSEVSHFFFSCLSENLPVAIKLARHLILEPHLPAKELDSVRELALQDLSALEDDPHHKVMVELSKRFFSFPFNRNEQGTVEGLKAITIDSLRRFYQESFVADRTIVGVAGKFDWEQVRDLFEEHFSQWGGSAPVLDPPTLPIISSSHHLPKETNQQQVALGYPSAAFGDPFYYTARVAVGVLSGGMSGRLFIEVREKRGLVYHVSASHSGARKRGAIIAYAGTTPENAETTLAVMLEELGGIVKGVTSDELQRAKADIKSKVVMQSELSGSRASALVSDWWHLQRVRPLEEIKQGIDAVTDADVRQYAAEFPVRPVTLVTLGPKKLELPK